MEGLLPFIYRAIVRYRENASQRKYTLSPSTVDSQESAYIMLPGDSVRIFSEIPDMVAEASLPSLHIIYKYQPEKSRPLTSIGDSWESAYIRVKDSARFSSHIHDLVAEPVPLPSPHNSYKYQPEKLRSLASIGDSWESAYTRIPENSARFSSEIPDLVVQASLPSPETIYKYQPPHYPSSNKVCMSDNTKV